MATKSTMNFTIEIDTGFQWEDKNTRTAIVDINDILLMQTSRTRDQTSGLPVFQLVIDYSTAVGARSVYFATEEHLKKAYDSLTKDIGIFKKLSRGL